LNCWSLLQQISSQTSSSVQTKLIGLQLIVSWSRHSGAIHHMTCQSSAAAGDLPLGWSRKTIATSKTTLRSWPRPNRLALWSDYCKHQHNTAVNVERSPASYAPQGQHALVINRAQVRSTKYGDGRTNVSKTADIQRRVFCKKNAIRFSDKCMARQTEEYLTF